jgi:hypothetical protein
LDASTIREGLLDLPRFDIVQRDMVEVAIIPLKHRSTAYRVGYHPRLVTLALAPW